MNVIPKDPLSAMVWRIQTCETLTEKRDTIVTACLETGGHYPMPHGEIPCGIWVLHLLEVEASGTDEAEMIENWVAGARAKISQEHPICA
jgi:hypothetical protein